MINHNNMNQIILPQSILFFHDLNMYLPLMPFTISPVLSWYILSVTVSFFV